VDAASLQPPLSGSLKLVTNVLDVGADELENLTADLAVHAGSNCHGSRARSPPSWRCNWMTPDHYLSRAHGWMSPEACRCT
jgi:hypothetical protein